MNHICSRQLAAHALTSPLIWSTVHQGSLRVINYELSALDDDGAPGLSAFAKLYLMLAEEAYQQIISPTLVLDPMIPHGYGEVERLL